MKKYIYTLLLLSIITCVLSINSYAQYCSAGSATCDEYISNVVCGTISNNSGACTSGGYANYSAQSTTIQKTTSRTITVTNGYSYSSDQCGIWVDWNNDLDFSDIGETMVVSGTPGNGPYTATITPPSNAYEGSVRMRIRICYTSGLDPCGNATYGEVEDYSINVTAAPVGLTTLLTENWNSPSGWTYGSGGAPKNNKWVVQSTYNVINGNTLTVLAGTNNSPYYLAGYNTTASCNINAYKNVSATGYHNQTLSFNWKCVGESSYDYGNVVYSTDGGSNWITIGSAYVSQSSTTSAVVSIPSACDNISYLIGFKWRNDGSGGTDPAFSIDDITITGEPLLPAAAGTIVGTANVCANQTGVAYYVPPITNATGYAWTLPTGATIATGNNTNSITVNFGTASGNISVHGTNSYGNGVESPVFPVIVTSIPSAAGTITGTSTLCQGTSAVYTVPAITGATGYNWVLPVGFNITSGSNTNSVTIFVSSAVNGNITVAGTNMCGTGTSSSPYTINVNPLPVAAGSITGTTTVCAASSGSYSVGTIANATSYSWSYSGTGVTFTPSNTVSNPTVNFASNATTGELAVYGVNACGNGTQNSIIITVNTVPGNPGSITGPSTLCQGSGGYVFSVPAISGATGYTWTLPTGLSISSGSNTNSITVSVASGAALSGNITVAGTNSCGTGATSSNFAITTIGVIGNAGSITGTFTVCQGQTYAYSVTAITNADANGYHWTLPVGATIASGANTNSITVTYSYTATTDNISVYGSNGCGSGSASSSLVTVNQTSVVPSIVYAYPNTVSIGMSSLLVVGGGALGTGATWMWYSGSCGGTYEGTGSSITVTPTSTTTYYVRAEGGPCGNTTCATVIVTVSSVPIYYGIVNCGANIHVFSGTYMYIHGDAAGDYNSSSACGPNGFLDIDGTIYIEGDWYNNNFYNSIPANALENTSDNDGYVEFIASANLQIIGGTSETTFENVVVNNTTLSSGDNVNLNTSMHVNGTLDLIDGVVKTGSNKVIVENSSWNSVLLNSTTNLPGNGNSFIDGNLKRKMASGSNWYCFPLGYGGHTTTNYYLIAINNNTLTWPGSTYIDSKVAALSNHLDADLLTAHVTEWGGSPYESIATQAMWTLTPTSSPTSGKYDVKCWITNIKTLSPLADNSFAILKRPDGTNGLNWNKGGGTINSNGGLGRMLTDDYALRKDLDNSLGSYFSEFGIAKTSSPLPVELLSFSALCSNDKVEVSWTTSSETNCDFYTVERSKDALFWENLTTVDGAGNSNSLMYYSVYDEKPFADITTSYYRLTQTDFNGSSETFPLVSVYCKEEINLQLINVFSEDAGTLVTFSAPSEEKYSIYLYDDQGNLLIETNDFSLAGFNQVLLNTSYISRGIYLVVLTDNKSLFTRKIIIN